MEVCLIQVPYMIGDEHQGGSKGPLRIVDAGAAERLEGDAVTIVRVDRGAAFRDSTNASLAVNKHLNSAVRLALSADRLPLVVAGSCDVSMGILAAFDHARCGVVWMDAHGDFNTPESTVSGFFGGMSLAVVTGHCYRSLWREVGDSTPIPEAAVVLLGARDLSPPAEQERLERSQINVVRWKDGKPEADVEAALDDLRNRVEDVYLHVDLDAVDPEVAPGIVDPPAPGGMSLQEVERAIRAACARLRLRAAALTTYNPERDADGRTLEAATRILETIAACARA
jgi:arginase